MKSIKNEVVNKAVGESVQQQFLALMRMVAFARNDATALGADFPAYCLDMAVAALWSELKAREMRTSQESSTATHCDGKRA